LAHEYVGFPDLPGCPGAQIDSKGFVTPAPIPESSAIALSLVGGFGLAVGTISRRKKA
jgi:hypothetical protein